MKRPTSVTKGVTLLYTAIVLAFLTSIAIILYATTHKIPQFSLTRTIVIEIIAILVFLFLTYQIAKGANWARITMLVLVILSVISKILSIPLLFAFSFMVGISTIVIMILQIIAMCFLYSKSSRPWFTDPTEENQLKQ